MLEWMEENSNYLLPVAAGIKELLYTKLVRKINATYRPAAEPCYVTLLFLMTDSLHFSNFQTAINLTSDYQWFQYW